MSLLCLDIGNTHITVGLFQAETLRRHWRLATDRRRTGDDYAFALQGMMQQAGCDPTAVSGAILASVVPDLTEVWVAVCRCVLGLTPRIFGSDLRPDIPIAYAPPHEVGADRLADVLAVRVAFALPVCIVDFGTATTFDAVDRDGVYRGGAIAPGVQIGADALFQRAALLPKVDLAPSPSPIGGNTRHALQSGLFWGYASLVEGMVRRFRQELGADMQVVGTGGLAAAFCRHLDLFDHFEPWLTLQGLRHAYGLARPEAARA